MVPNAKDLSLQKAESLTAFLKLTGTQLIDTIHEDLNRLEYTLESAQVGPGPAIGQVASGHASPPAILARAPALFHGGLENFSVSFPQ